jgi:UDP-GlcNAc:undecaprenyl-phosphate GlcNAc-1-phosphate transferase
VFVYLTIVFSTACVASGVLTALVCRLAPRVGLTDSPDGHRKIHRGPTPLGGGLAVFVATAAVLSLLLVVPGPLRASLRENWPGLASLLLAGAVVVAVGLIDDLLGAGAKPSRRAGTAGAGASGTAPAPKGLRGRQKLLGQVLAAAIVLAGGLLIERIRILDWQITLGPLAVPFTLFWLLGAINALNLLDGIDGLAATLGLILTSTVAVMAVLIGRPQVALTALVFAGALLGFLRFNFPPARVFLGDAGSMLIGLVVGTLAIQGSLKGPGTVLLAAPLAVWTIPIFDSTAAILRRKLTGRSVYATDRCHLHHRLLDRLGSTASEARDSRRSATIQRKVLGLVAVASTATSAGALVSIFSNHDLIALVTCAGVVVIFVVTDVFGRAECVLLASRLRRIGLSFLAQARSRQAEASETTCRLQGSRQWERPWRALTEAAEKLRLRRIRLDVNHPAAQEAYHATW